MKEKIGFFEATPGNYSIMRAAFAWLIFQATAMGWYALISDSVGAAVAVFAAIAGVATGLKIIQKQQEKQENK